MALPLPELPPPEPGAPGEIIRFPGGGQAGGSAAPPIIHLIDWNAVAQEFHQGIDSIAEKVGEWLGLTDSEQSLLLGQTIDNILRFEHTMNIRWPILQGAIMSTQYALWNLGNEFNDFVLNQLSMDASIVSILAQLTPGTGTPLPVDEAALLAKVQGLIDAAVVPLRENIGEIRDEIAQLRTQIAAPTIDPRVSALENEVRNLRGWLDTNVVPILGPVVGLLALNIPQALADEEACCAANSKFKDDWSDLLNKLRPLLNLLKLVDIVALLALLEHIWEEGATGFIGEMLGIIEGAESGAQSKLARFLGV